MHQNFQFNSLNSTEIRVYPEWIHTFNGWFKCNEYSFNIFEYLIELKYTSKIYSESSKESKSLENQKYSNLNKKVLENDSQSCLIQHMTVQSSIINK